MSLRSAKAEGDCYEANAKWLMDKHFRGEDLGQYMLCHGEVTGQGPMDGINFGHAWIEDGGTVLDFSNGGRTKMAKAVYYMTGRIALNNNVHRYTWREALLKLVSHEVYGPWDLRTSTGL